VFVFLCSYYGKFVCVRLSLFLLYFLLVAVRLSVAVQSIAWKDSSPK